MRREQTFDTSLEAFQVMHMWCKHGWHGHVEKSGTRFKVVIFC
jgi:hypothetical protein